MHKIMSGTLGLTDAQDKKLRELVQRAWDSRSGKAKPLTDNMHEQMLDLFDKKRNPELGKTAIKEFRKVYRMNKFGRDFPITNKYVQKGIEQEQEAITVFQKYLIEVMGTHTHLTKNTVRFENDFFSGEPDNFDLKNPKLGYDIKSPWSLESFPMDGDELDMEYEYQNQTYMDLTGRDEWWTVSVLVNAGEHQLNNEKMKWYYACQMHNGNISDEKREEYTRQYEKMCRVVEKMMIYDYDRFIELFPFHQMEHTRDEWHGEGYDLPLEERVVIRKSYRNPELIKEMKQRVRIGREYIKTLEKNHK